MSILQRGSASVFLALLLLIAAFPLITDSDSVRASHRRAVTLQPGENFIGWFDGKASVRVLFEAIPALESVWAWDAENLFGSEGPGWLTARRDSTIPESRPLHTVAPGMGLSLFISGDSPVDLWVARTPAVGSVELYADWNLVAWLGRDTAYLADAVRGVGQSLDSAHSWDSTRGGWCSYRPALGRLNPSCTVQPGGAVWVNVDQDVNWLQPTGKPPPVVFADEDSLSIKKRVNRDLNAAMDFFADEWGVQADHSRTTIYVAADGDSLVDVARRYDHQCLRDEGRVRENWKKYAAWYCGVAGGDSVIVLKKGRWELVLRNEGQASPEGRYDLVHEYTHAVQHQLGGGWSADQPTWLVEGMAFWVEGLLYVDDQGRDRDWLRRDNEVRLQGLRPGRPHYNLHAPDLKSLAARGEHGSGAYRPWEYELGSIAVERLAGSAVGGRHVRQESILEYWRVVADPHCDDGVVVNDEGVVVEVVVCQAPEPMWKDAFERAFGRSIHRFYEEFVTYRASFDEGGRELPEGAVMADEGEIPGGPFTGQSQHPQ